MREYQFGDVVQIRPNVDNWAAGCFMVVDSTFYQGVQGYINIPDASSVAYFRASLDDVEYVGKAVWNMSPLIDGKVVGDDLQWTSEDGNATEGLPGDTGSTD
jgi:hypothetical protein